jgi:hypothetical protein
VIKPVVSIFAFVTQATGDYGEGEFKPDKAYPYIAFGE